MKNDLTKPSPSMEVLTMGYMVSLCDSIAYWTLFCHVFNRWDPTRDMNVSMYTFQHLTGHLQRWLWNDSPWKDEMPEEKGEQYVVDIDAIEAAMLDVAEAYINNYGPVDDRRNSIRDRFYALKYRWQKFTNTIPDIYGNKVDADE